jgi:hypothetical protein
MAFEASRKRKRKSNDNILRTPSPPPQVEVPGAPVFRRDDSDHGVLEKHMRSRQTFVNPFVQDNARAHFGDNYYITNSKTETATEEAQHQALKTALSFDRMDFRQADIDPAYAETDQWIFEDDRFLRWCDPAFRSSNHGILWIKGKPGSGKSTLMKCVFERLERSPGCTVVAFFFNAKGTPLEYSVEGCYRSLLLQILKRIPRLQASLDITNVPAEGQHWEAAVVRAHLREAVLHLQDQPLVLMIDALDECEPQEVRTLVYFLTSLAASTGSHSVSFNICLASRHYPNISIRFCENLIVENHDAHRQDIYKYVQDNLHVELEAHRDALLEPLMQRSQGVFMWIILVIRRLNEHFEKGANLQRLLSEIHALSGDLDALIRGIIYDGASDPCLLPTLLYTLAAIPHHIASHDPAEFCSAVLFAAGRLSSPSRRSCMIDLQNQEAMERFVLSSSKGLVEVHDHDGHRSDVQFIHESVRQHILNGGLAFLHPDLDRNVKPRSSMILANWCQDFIRRDFWTEMGVPRDQHSGAIARSNPGVKAAMEQRWNECDYPLLSYVVGETFDHMEAAYLEGALDLNRLRAFPLHRWISIVNARSGPPYRARNTFTSTATSASLLYVALQSIKYPNDRGIIRGLLERHPMNPNVSGIALREETNQEFSEMLFGLSLDTSYGHLFGTPLALAAQRGLSSFIDLLLDCGANINLCGDGNALSLTPVEQASEDHNSVAIDFLGPETFAHWTSSPLTIACCTDSQLSVVRALLTRGANINMYSGPWNNPLGAALDHNCLATAELLVDYGADVNLEDDKGFNIALKAAFGSDHFRRHRGNDGIIKMLFRRGAHDKLEALNVFLHEAVVLGRVVAAKLLVQAGADPQCKNKQGCTALYGLAESRASPLSMGEPIAVAALLLDLGVDINAIGGQYDTALIAASFSGKAELVKWLLEHGVDVRYRSREYGTALDVIRASERYRHTQDQADIIYMLSKAGLE